MRKFLVWTMLTSFAVVPGLAQEKLLIAAASDLKFAMDSIVIVFKHNHPATVEVTYGSSGKFYEQITQGAPFDIYFSADVSYPEELKKANLATSDVYRYGKGRIVLWCKKIDPNKKGMQSLRDPSIKKIALANPAHAPYGKRAVESLSYYKLSEVTKSKIVYGENISQAAQFVFTGAADVGIIALSLARSPNMKNEGRYYLIPEESHQALIQGAIITLHGKQNTIAKNFMTFVKGDAARAILKYFGFSEP